jgi:hypothetical protein
LTYSLNCVEVIGVRFAVFPVSLTKVFIMECILDFDVVLFWTRLAKDKEALVWWAGSSPVVEV